MTRISYIVNGQRVDPEGRPVAAPKAAATPKGKTADGKQPAGDGDDEGDATTENA